MTAVLRRCRHRLIRLRAEFLREDGWAGTVVLTIGTLFLLLGAVQIALWFNASNIAQVSAQSAYTVARSYESTAEQGQAAAMQLIEGIPGALHDPKVTVNRTGDTVTVTVTGRATDAIPGLTLAPVSFTITGPVERWVPAP